MRWIEQSARKAKITQLPKELCREYSVESPPEVESQGVRALTRSKAREEVENHRSHTVERRTTSSKAVLIKRDPVTELRQVLDPSLHQPLKKLAQGRRVRDRVKLPSASLWYKDEQRELSKRKWSVHQIHLINEFDPRKISRHTPRLDELVLYSTKLGGIRGISNSRASRDPPSRHGPNRTPDVTQPSGRDRDSQVERKDLRKRFTSSSTRRNQPSPA